MSEDFDTIASLLHVSRTTAIFFVIAIVLWSLYWKGRALWMASRSSDKVWFVILLVANTIGILEIVYIYLLAKPGDPEYEGENKIES